MNAKALLDAKNLNDFIKKYKDLIRMDWNIRMGEEIDRSKVLKFNAGEFRKQFQLQYDTKVQNESLVSYLDTMVLLTRLNEKLSDISDIDVFMEFMIPYTHQKRIDYLLAFHNTIILLEFSYYKDSDSLNDGKKYMNQYHQKLSQVMQYEKLLQNLLDYKFKTFPFVIIYKPEFTKDNVEIIENRNANNLEIDNLVSMIRLLYSKETNAALAIYELLDNRNDNEKTSSDNTEEILDRKVKKDIDYRKLYAIRNNKKQK